MSDTTKQYMTQGDHPCGDCGTKKNPIWFTDNVFWNRVMGEERGKILCVYCFIERAEKIFDCAWRLLPSWGWKKK